MKHPKLRGADVYVARLGNTQGSRERKSSANEDEINAKPEKRSPRDDRSSTSLLVVADGTLTGSLHDELLCKEPKHQIPKESANRSSKTVIGRDSILDSRPCYRCVLYMHSAGIRRVYWTNKHSQWESAKVRDLFDQVSGADICDGHDVNNSSLGDVFVTKHEILMLRRLSG
ncbi:hypothetical protein F4677DRAFT_431009 [Hypoxylon crocopeplum]|nr:hypothetical protein F4677DRAFT_431009 [Hypoxylon crocopeplum]